MTFDSAMEREFPGAVPASTFVSRTQSLLAQHGLDARSTLLCLVTCPDEKVDGLRQDLRRAWGAPFDAASLAGVPSVGPTGVKAAVSHAPIRSGRRRILCVSLAHIGLGPAGEVGWCLRPGVDEPTVACGALSALCSGAVGDEPIEKVRGAEPQLAWLMDRLRPAEGGQGEVCLLATTHAAAEAGHTMFRDLLAEVVDRSVTDYAIVSGVQVHGPTAGREYVWPAHVSAVIGGREIPMAFG